MISSHLHYVTFPGDGNVLSWILSAGNFSRLDTTWHPVSRFQECSYFLFENDKEKISIYCQISILNQTRDQAFTVDTNFRAIPTLSPRQLYVTCLTYSYPLNLRHPTDMIYLPNSSEAISDSFFLPSNDEWTCEQDSRKLGIMMTNFEEIWKISGFAWI